MAPSPTTRTVAVVALILVVALPVAASFGGPAPEVQGWRQVKTADGSNPYQEDTLEVFVSPDNLSGRPRVYVDEVKDALAYWEQADEPDLRWLEGLERTLLRDEAEIVVEFHDVGRLLLQTPDGRVPSLGLGIPGNATVPGAVDLTTRLGCTELYRSRDQVEELATHELGHALGLDHVDDPDHPMSHRGTFAGVANPLDVLLESPNDLPGRVAGLAAPLTAPASCYLAG